MLLSFPPVAISPRGYVSLGAMMHTQDTKFEWPDMQCISVKPLSGLSKRGTESKDILSEQSCLCRNKQVFEVLMVRRLSKETARGKR